MVNVNDAKPIIEPLTGIPIALRAWIYKCDHCNQVHVELQDDACRPFAGIVLTDEMVYGIVDVFNDKITEWPPTTEDDDDSGPC